MTFLVLFFWLCASTLLIVSGSSSDASNSAGPTPQPTESCVEETCTANDYEKATTTKTTTTEAQYDEECGIWLALSTLPGTGIGMFAGKAFVKKEMLMAAGDHLVPIIDFNIYQRNEEEPFLWREYTWNPSSFYMDTLGVDEVTVASPGFGSAANSFMDFVNADELYPTYSIPNGLHRRSDPGAGAFTYYHSRAAWASANIEPGDELFVSYGNHWFNYRKDKLGPIPVEGDHKRAQALYSNYRRIIGEIENKTSHAKGHAKDSTEHVVELHSTETTTTGNIPPPTRRSHLADLGEDLWDNFVLGSPWVDNSPTMAALPPKEDYEEMYKGSLRKMKKSRMIRDSSWLQENGVCADTMHFGESTLRQAGHGAFASRRLRKDAIVLPIPLIHIPDRRVLNMYVLNGDSEKKAYKRDTTQPTRPQLLLNYCLGHRASTLLLSPYGPVFNLINHNQTLANVKLQWASPHRSQHNPDLLNMTLTDLFGVESSQLAMELVALRNIEPGEEIFLDYGNEWEAAWQKHVEEWKPVEGADSYISAFEMNQQFGHVFRTEFEQMKHPYPPNLMLKFHKFFLDEDDTAAWIEKYPHPVKMPLNTWMENQSVECEILRRTQTENRTLYSVMIPTEDDKPDGESFVLENIPQEAIFFQDGPYSTDMFLDNAFRHDIRIPDAMFPKKWRNIKSK